MSVEEVAPLPMLRAEYAQDQLAGGPLGIQTQNTLIAVILLLALLINTALQERRIKHRLPFLAMLGAFLIYNASFFFVHVFEDNPFWPNALVLSGIAVAQTLLRFHGRFLRHSMEPALTLLNIGSVGTLLVVVTGFGEPILGSLLSAGLGLGAYAYCFFRLLQRYRKSERPDETKRLGLLAYGGGVAVLFTALDLLPLVDVPFPSAGHLLNTAYLYLWAQVLLGRRVLDLQEMVSRSLVLFVQALVVTLIYIALAFLAIEHTGWLIFNTLVASFLLILTIDPLRRIVDLLLGHLLFREKYEFKAQLGHLRRELRNVINLGDMVAVVLKRLQETRRITHTSVFLFKDDGSGYFLADHIGPIEIRELGVVQGHAFLDRLNIDHQLSGEQLSHELEDHNQVLSPVARERLELIRETMIQMRSHQCFGLLSGERLTGWLNIHDDRQNEPFSSLELAEIANVAAQMTTIIENSELFETIKKRERLLGIGKMATGMAHEIRNPLGAIKAAAQLLNPDQQDDEERSFVQVIIEETDRLNKVIGDFLDYARPFRGELQSMQINRILTRTGTLVKTEDRTPPVQVKMDLATNLPPVMGNADQLLQVCLNLARNAIDAMEEDGGTLTISSRLIGQDDQARIEVKVQDTGHGISSKVLKDLFIPFFTTKGGGTGLGLAISERIMQHHGSKLRVESTIGEGTAMIFELPPADETNPLTGEHRRRLNAEVAA